MSGARVVLQEFVPGRIAYRARGQHPIHKSAEVAFVRQRPATAKPVAGRVSCPPFLHQQRTSSALVVVSELCRKRKSRAAVKENGAYVWLSQAADVGRVGAP